MHIVCSTGFYYTDEPVLYNMSEEKLAEYIVADAKQTNAGIIKAAVENKKLKAISVLCKQGFANKIIKCVED